MVLTSKINTIIHTRIAERGYFWNNQTATYIIFILNIKFPLFFKAESSREQHFISLH